MVVVVGTSEAGGAYEGGVGMIRGIGGWMDKVWDKMETLKKGLWIQRVAKRRAVVHEAG